MGSCSLYDYTSCLKFILEPSANEIDMPRLPIEQRWRGIGMFEAGESQQTIARRLGCSQPAIANLISWYVGTGSVEDHPRTGRPRVTTPNQDRYMVLQHLRDRFRPATRTAAETVGLHNNRVSPGTVRNRLHDEQLHSRSSCRGQTLTAAHRRNRLNWCRQYRR